MAIEFFSRAAGIDLQHVPHRGGSQAITDVIGGQLPLVAVNALRSAAARQGWQAARARGAEPEPVAHLSGRADDCRVGLSGFEASVWYGFIAPANTPKAIVTRLHDEVQKALQQEVGSDLPMLVARCCLASEQFAGLIRNERQRYAKLVREANIKPD
jgi:tripartite-type tricarboxylate transporter receptor subunit TctC